ncbi:MAG: hypothetical protein NE327_03040 [Lentisphaeraceae bacterium]|nr:hypothetical protein [Lentisphaeraceae bacterium]
MIRAILFLFLTSSLMAQTVKDSTGFDYIVVKGNELYVKSKRIVIDKNKFNSNTGLVLAVKHKTDSIKFYDSSGKLAWKVKLYDDKIKISDNEENKNAWQLKMKGDKVKVYDPMETEKFRIYLKDAKELEVKTSSKKLLFKSAGTKLALAPGVLALEHIPETHRAIIFYELNKLKR